MTQRLFNLARMTVSSSGVGVITLNSAVAGFATFAQTGVPAAGTVSYAINDTNQSEIGVGIYSSGGGLTLGSTGGGATRTPILNSVGTSTAIAMSNAAQVFITPNVTDWPFLLDVAGTTAITSDHILIGTTPVTIGGAASAFQIQSDNTVWSESAIVYGNTATAAGFAFAKTRNASATGQTIVQNGDGIAGISGYGSDGVNFILMAQMSFEIDAAPGVGSMPGRIVFKTTPGAASATTNTLGTTTNYFGYSVVSNVMDFGANALASLVLTTSSGLQNDGPGLQLYHNSPSPAADDNLGYIEWFGNNAAAAVVPYAGMHTFLQDTTAGAEDGKVAIFVRKAGALSSANPADLALWVLNTGNGNPGHTMHIEAASGTFMIDNTEAGVGGPILGLYQNSASPLHGDALGKIAFYGKNSAAAFKQYSQIYSFLDDPTSTSEDALLVFSNVVAGAFTDLGYFGAGLVLDTPTGGDKGLGTLNCTAAYDDNVLLTCYPLQATEMGAIDLDYWDSVVPNKVKAKKIIERRHEPARKFAARLGTEYDPTTIAGQRKHIKDKRHMTMYPNPDKWTEETRPSIGHLLQCGLEADELLMIYITQLEDRLAVVEARNY